VATRDRGGGRCRRGTDGGGEQSWPSLRAWRSLRQDARKTPETLGSCKECQVEFFVEFFVSLAGILCDLPRTGEVLTGGVVSVAQRTPTGAKNAK